jgi:CTP synthase (UTP-ammonia lyase)
LPQHFSTVIAPIRRPHQKSSESKWTMQSSLRVGVIGDYSAASRFHRATNAALEQTAAALSVAVEIVWLPTTKLASMQPAAILGGFDALWCAPGSPYQSMEGALQAIRYAREQGRPFIGT